MANPFLVLGGIAISVATAAFGILQVPGWVASAQDAAAINDVAQVTAAQAAASSETGRYASSFETLTATGSVKVTAGAPSVGTSADPTGKHHVTVARSASRTYFARLSGSSTIGKGATATAAVIAAGTTVTDGVTAEGVQLPVVDEVVATNYAINPLATSLNGFDSDADRATLSLITDFPGQVKTAVRSTSASNGEPTRHLAVVTGDKTPHTGKVRVTLAVRASADVTITMSIRSDVNFIEANVTDAHTVTLKAGEVTEIDHVFTATSPKPATARSGLSIRSASGHPVGTTVDFTRISITDADDGVGFFYGGSGKVGDTYAHWAGEPGRSPSVLVR